MEAHGLHPPDPHRMPDWVAVSASNYPRTHTSAQALLRGLLGSDDEGAVPEGPAAGVRVPAPHAENINGPLLPRAAVAGATLTRRAAPQPSAPARACSSSSTR